MTRLPQDADARSTFGAWRRVRWAFACVLVIANLLAFRRAIGWDIFHNTDSEVMLGVASEAGWRQALGWLGGPWIGASLCNYYRPTSSWLMWVEWRAFGLEAAGYQAVSMAMHLAAALLFWRIAVRLLQSEPLGALAALIFSLRPANAPTMAALTAQPDLAAAAFMFLSLWCLASYTRPRVRGCAADAPPGGRGAPWLLAVALAAMLLALGSKESALSLPALASLVVLFDRTSSRRRKALVIAAFWLALGAFLLWRTHAMSGLGYVPHGWRGPTAAALTLLRSGGAYFLSPFAWALRVRDWWPLVMFAVVALLALAMRRWPALRTERGVLYLVGPLVAGAAAGLAALFYGTWAAALVPMLWWQLGAMLLYAAAAVVVIRRDGRAAAFVVAWGLLAFVPVAYRVYNWTGKFDYFTHTFWALGGALLAEAAVARWARRGDKPAPEPEGIASGA